MATPTILGTACSTTSASTTLTVTLPSWTAGDLALVFITTDFGSRSWSSSGWTSISGDSNTTIPSGQIFRRKLQAGDSNPVFTMSPAVSRVMSAIAVIIDDGTYSTDADPIDVATAVDAWNEGTSTTPQASAVTTNTDDALAFAVCTLDAATSNGQSPYSVTTSGWTETHSADCYTPGGFGTGLIVADKVIATAGTTGAVDFSLSASDQWSCAILAVKPSAAAGINVAVPLATYTIAGQLPTIATGAAVEVPLATYTIAGQLPTIATGAAVEVPLATYTIAGQVPVVEAGAAVAVEVPLATYTIAGQLPTIATGAAVEVPLASYTVAGQLPTIATAAVIDVPLATYTISGQTPTITVGVSVIPFPSVAIEDDDDLIGVMTHDNVTLVHGGQGYLGTIAESDGLTLDGGIATDGWLELQMLASDITAGGIAEHDAATISGTAYTIDKIDVTGTGMALLYLVPQ